MFIKGNRAVLCWFLLVCCLVTIIGGVGTAAEERSFLPDYGEPEEMEEISPFWVLLRLVFYLAAVLMLFYLLARFVRNRWGTVVSSKHMGIVDRLSLGTNRDVFIIRLGNRFFLIGASGESISLLTELDSSQMEIPWEHEGARLAETSFGDVLSRYNKGGFLTLEALEGQLSRFRDRDGEEEGKGQQDEG